MWEKIPGDLDCKLGLKGPEIEERKRSQVR